MFQGTTGKILSRLEAEKNNPVADIVVLASVASMDGLKATDQLQSYEAAKTRTKLTVIGRIKMDIFMATVPLL